MNTVQNPDVLLREGDWRVLQSWVYRTEKYFYCVEHVSGHRTYIFSSNSALEFYGSNCIRLLESNSIPEAIKDFIKTLVILQKI